MKNGDILETGHPKKRRTLKESPKYLNDKLKIRGDRP